MISIQGASQSPVTVVAPYIAMSTTSAGMVRFNGNKLEAYDGHSWLEVLFSTQLQFDYQTREVLQWATEKRNEELKLKAMCEKYPSLKDLKEKLDVVLALVREQETNGTS